MRASWHTPFFSWAEWGIAEGPLPLSVQPPAPTWQSVAGRRVCLFPDCDTTLSKVAHPWSAALPLKKGMCHRQAQDPQICCLGPTAASSKPGEAHRHGADSCGCQGLL